MAMASKDIYNVFSENFLTCHICLEEYKDPRVLPCYHTFCLKCIADHAANNGVQNKFSCPVCRQEAPIPPGGLETLLKNFFLRKVTDFMKGLRAPEGRLYEYCNHKEAIFMCKGCPKTNQLCATCCNVHEKIPSCMGHSFAPLSQVDLSANPVITREQLRHILDKTQFCDKHDGGPLAFYCENDDTVICRECIVKVHSKHDFNELGDVVKVQRDLIQEKLRCLPAESFEKAENVIVQTEERLTENQKKVLRLVDSQKLAMTKEIKENSKTIEREIKDYYQQVEKVVRQQTDAYLTTVKKHLKTYETKVQSEYIEMQKALDDKINEITTEVKTLTSAQRKTLEAEKDKISIKSICDFAQQLTDTGSDIEVMTHSKKLQTRFQELQTVEPDFDINITDITFTPGQTEMNTGLQFLQIPGPQPLKIKMGTITAKTYRGPLDACFGSLKQKRANYSALKEFPKVTFLDKPVRNICFKLRGLPWDIQCTDDGCILVLHGDFFGKTVSVFSSTGQCNRDISIEGGGRCITTVSNDRFVVTCREKCCTLYSTSGQVVQCFGQGDMSNPLGVTVDHTEGKVYVCDSGAQCICVYGMISFQLVNRIPIPMCSKGSLRCAYHHGINAIIVSDYSAHCVYAVTPQGDEMFQYGAQGQSGSGDGQLNSPRGVCVDKFGHIFIADFNNHRVVVLGSDGRFLHNILSRSDDIGHPISVDVNSNGELVVITIRCEISIYKYIHKK